MSARPSADGYSTVFAEVAVLRRKLAEATTPRPMSEAPRPLPFTHPELEPGMTALVVFEGSCPLGGDTTEDWCIDKHDKAVGWLPAADENEEP